MKPIEKKTRQIFHKIHVEQAKDEPTFKRLVDLLSPRYLKVPDDFFDFTHCSGVLHHTTDAFKGIRELARVTKKGGMLYIYIHGQGGLMREVVNFLRDKYRRDRNYKRLIDKIDETFLWELWDWTTSEMAKHGDKMGEDIPKDIIKQLLNKDLALSIKDRMTAPLSQDFTEKELRDLLKDEGFTKIERLTRYPNNKNIRRFLSPFYNRYDHKFSRFFYGHIYYKRD